MGNDVLHHPCRVVGIPASDAPIVALLRRGPSRWVQLICWHTDTDTFLAGQWLRGHIFPWRSALSPDGRLFVYFVAKIDGRTLADEEFTHAWTAVSQPPYFTALALWPKGDTWNGGGVFRDNHTLLLNHDANHMHRRLRTNRLRIVAGSDIPWYRGGGEESIHGAILAQQGWQLIQPGRIDDKIDQVRMQMQTPLALRRPLYIALTVAMIWQKPQTSGPFVLRQTFYGVDYHQYGDQNVMDWDIIDTASGREQRLTAVEWADWDQQGRVIFTRQGQVWATTPSGYPDGAVCLADLNEHRPERILAPPWARKWPAPVSAAPLAVSDPDSAKGSADE